MRHPRCCRRWLCYHSSIFGYFYATLFSIFEAHTAVFCIGVIYTANLGGLGGQGEILVIQPANPTIFPFPTQWQHLPTQTTTPHTSTAQSPTLYPLHFVLLLLLHPRGNSFEASGKTAVTSFSAPSLSTLAQTTSCTVSSTCLVEIARPYCVATYSIKKNTYSPRSLDNGDVKLLLTLSDRTPSYTGALQTGSYCTSFFYLMQKHVCYKL